MSKTESYRLSDSTIGQIVKLFQLGILTGTDISDQIRIMKVVVNDDNMTIEPCPDYVSIFEENLTRMSNFGQSKDDVVFNEQ
tara:strand:+ start:259 stop:504 length:246 start_codon:yes stop_codon:yes gene_type:complete